MLSFVLSKLAWGVLNPGNALVLTLALGALMLRRPRWRRFGERLIALVALAFLAVTFAPVGAFVALPLENRFPYAEPLGPEPVDGIIMLGGAVNPPLTADRGDPSLNDAAERVLAFADLVRRFPAARAVFTGGSGRLLGQDTKEDASIRAALLQAGIPEDRVLYETESRNTWENAVFSRDLAAPKPGERWLLVTSAMHMPRSVGIFRRVGWAVVPYPVDYRTRHDARPYARFELDRNLPILGDAVREWIGLVSYRLMDRTDALFPAP
ncbi:YdcF family protein [Azospirillum doebereinerae]|nr:YdcF family protein [Azospirillum doebereinerae]